MPYFIYSERKIFYKKEGSGEPLLLIHDNSASSRMFTPVLKYYTDKFTVILIDLPGHGRSARVDSFPKDFWFENSKAVYELIKHLEIPEVNVIGTGGGAKVALNLLLEHPDTVKAVIADSFEGEESIDEIAAGIHAERNRSKKIFSKKLFWLRNHGSGWKRVVDMDSDAVYSHHMELKKFFHRDLSAIKKPVLLTGSLDDEYFKSIIVELYAELKEKIRGSRSHYFHSGGHPAMISCGDEFAKVAANFFTTQ